MEPSDTDADYKSGTIRNIRRNFNKKTLYELLPRHAKFTPDLLLKLQQIPISILENRACPLAIKVYKMAREVSKDCERAKQFTRTQINDHGLLYGTVMLKHHTCDLVLNFFHNRYPLFTVALYNHLKKETYSY